MESAKKEVISVICALTKAFEEEEASVSFSGATGTKRVVATSV